MGKLNVYIADYLMITTHSQAQSDALAGNGSIVGEPLVISFDDKTGTFPVTTQQGIDIGTVTPSSPLSVREALGEGFTQRTHLTLVAYDPNKKFFLGELAYQFYKIDPKNPERQEYFDRFADTVSDMIAHGKRPVIQPGKDSYSKVIESEGHWIPENFVPEPTLPEHSVVLKKKRSFTDGLMLAAFSGKPGCRIASMVFLLLVLLIIAALIVKFMV